MLAFRKKIEDGGTLLYKPFRKTADLEELITESLIDLLWNLHSRTLDKSFWRRPSTSPPVDSVSTLISPKEPVSSLGDGVTYGPGTDAKHLLLNIAQASRSWPLGS